jgi:hypothetical protein
MTEKNIIDYEEFNNILLNDEVIKNLIKRRDTCIEVQDLVTIDINHKKILPNNNITIILKSIYDEMYERAKILFQNYMYV